MPANLTSTIIEDRVQADGRRAVGERHVDQFGNEQFINYLAESGADINAAMTARVAGLATLIEQREIAEFIDRLPNSAPRYVTVAQLAAAIRARLQTARGPEVGRLAKWLLGRTDAQLRAAFGMTQAQVDALKVRLQTAANRYDDANALAGE